jgi:hypothetical protein
MISALSGGLALKRLRICGWMTTTIRPAQDQKDQHPHQKDAGRGNLEGIEFTRHVLLRQ